ncbi:MAG: metallophosphoesterase [Candidatus Gastranaerophilales bacterium]|nr:metallophosphoesterase [Candidatus Gastranaerophilales bacterium]
MRKILALILMLFMFNCASDALAREKTLTFAQISDSHLSLSGKNYRGRDVIKSAEFLEKAVKEINKNKDVQFVLFTGDNIDNPKKEELVAFLKIVNKLHKPYYMLIGNHEVFKNQGFTKKDYMHTVWWRHPQMFFKGPNYVLKPNNELVFIIVDGTNEIMPSPSGYFKENTLEWLDKKLKKYQNKKVVIVQHYPIFHEVRKTSHDIMDKDKYLQTINSYDNIIAIIAGHFHSNSDIYRKGIYYLSAPGFVAEPHEYKIITFSYDTKYLFADPSEFSVETKTYPTMEVKEPVETIIPEGN